MLVANCSSLSLKRGCQRQLSYNNNNNNNKKRCLFRYLLQNPSAIHQLQPTEDPTTSGTKSIYICSSNNFKISLSGYYTLRIKKILPLRHSKPLLHLGISLFHTYIHYMHIVTWRAVNRVYIYYKVHVKVPIPIASCRERGKKKIPRAARVLPHPNTLCPRRIFFCFLASLGEPGFSESELSDMDIYIVTKLTPSTCTYMYVGSRIFIFSFRIIGVRPTCF